MENSIEKLWKELLNDPLQMMFQIVRISHKEIRKDLDNKNFSQTRNFFFPLHLIWQQGKGKLKDQKELAALMDVTPATIAELLQRLEEKKLIFRMEDGKDRRRKLISLTEKGEMAMMKNLQTGVALSQKAFKDFGKPEKDLLMSQFERIINNLLEDEPKNNDLVFWMKNQKEHWNNDFIKKERE